MPSCVRRVIAMHSLRIIHHQLVSQDFQYSNDSHLFVGQSTDVEVLGIGESINPAEWFTYFW